jgi:hypothetical protein
MPQKRTTAQCGFGNVLYVVFVSAHCNCGAIGADPDTAGQIPPARLPHLLGRGRAILRRGWVVLLAAVTGQWLLG